MTIVLIILFSLLSIIGCYLVLRPQLEVTEAENTRIAEINASYEAEYKRLAAECQALNYEYQTALIQNSELKANNAAINGQIQEQKNALSLLEQQSKESAEIFYQKNLEIAQTNLEQSLEKERTKYCREIEILAEELQIAREEGVEGYLSHIAAAKLELNNLTNQIEQLRANTNAAIEADKRAEEMKEKKDFYRIKLTSEDIEEIRKLRSILPYLRDKEPLNKVIWKVYYEKPLNELIGRVIGPGTHTGIYKITDIENGKCYIGQAANLSDRWKQHVKRGVGAEAATRNKLYPIMLEKGPESFTFEVLEECGRADLDAREDYFQEFYQAITWGYSIK